MRTAGGPRDPAGRVHGGGPPVLPVADARRAAGAAGRHRVRAARHPRGRRAPRRQRAPPRAQEARARRQARRQARRAQGTPTH